MLKDKCPCFAQNKWVFPGGHIDKESDPIQALKRELKEETSMNLVKSLPVRTNIYKYPSGWRYRVYFKCGVKGKIKLSQEHSEYKWITKRDIRKMVFRDRDLKKVVIEFLR